MDREERISSWEQSMMMNDKSRRLKPKQSPFGKQDLKRSSRMMGQNQVSVVVIETWNRENSSRDSR